MTVFARYFLAICMALLLTACATNQQMVNNRLTLPEAIPAGDGVLLVKLVGVQPLSASNAKWGTIKVINKKDGKTTDLHDTAPPFAGYSLFMGTLPKGEYELTGLEAMGPAPATFGVIPALIIMGMTSDQRSIKAQLSSFRIRPGTLTNLGVIVSALPEEKGASMKLAVLADAAGKTDALLSAESKARDRINRMESISWDKMPDADASAKALDIIRAHARNISTLETTPDNRLLIGSALGMLHVRNPGGAWSTMPIGAFDTITYVRALSDGRIFAAADTSKYFLWTPERQAWQQYKLGDGDYKITHVEQMGEHGFAIVTATLHAPTLSRPYKTMVLFKAKLDDPAESKVLLSIDGASATGKAATFYNGEELRFIFNHVGFSRTADLYRIHPVTHEKKVEKLDYWATDMYRLPGGQLVMDRVNGLTVYNSFSSDNGKTWRHNSTGGPSSMRFLNPDKGMGFSVVSMGWSANTIGLNKTENGGKTWARIGTTLEGEGIMPLRLLNGQVFVFTGRKLLSTADEGKTWKTEWPLTAEK